MVARLLLLSINFFTNLFYFQIFSLHEARPEPGHLGWISIFIPVIGGLIVGLLARFGSKAMREELYSLTPKSVEFSVKTIRP